MIEASRELEAELDRLLPGSEFGEGAASLHQDPDRDRLDHDSVDISEEREGRPPGRLELLALPLEIRLHAHSRRARVALAAPAEGAAAVGAGPHRHTRILPWRGHSVDPTCPAPGGRGSMPARISGSTQGEIVKNFKDKIAVVTGGGTGMGRELCRQLAGAGCHIAMCDVSDENMKQTKMLSEAGAPAGLRVTTFVADVSSEEQVNAFRDAVVREHETDYVNLVFNNAGIGGGGSIVAGDREEWDKTFDVCWGGVYYGTRAFLPLLLAAEEGHVINTSSVNGFWASLGPSTAHTAYSAAKFAVKGFTEALVNDFRNNAPHLKASLVMPGHIGTSIIINSGKILGTDPKELPDERLAEARERLGQMGFPIEALTNDQIRQALQERAESFRDDAPMTAAEAATVILDGVRDERWRILIGEDAVVLDELVREAPEEAYEPSFMERLTSRTKWELGS